MSSPLSAEKRHITFVCTGNICRSPMAEGLIRHALKTETGPLRTLAVRSVGIAAFAGSPASDNAVRALKKVSIDISAHRSCPATPEIIETSLAVFAMTTSHLLVLRRRFPRLPADTFLMREFYAAALPNAPLEIPDPYGFDLAEYESCRDSMVEAIPSLLAFLRKKLG
ncbi:MAG: low molecular weight protein arginine phosphatase [Puniceicoccales bacterium]|jgi:protein-tyrosine-phosphatase|nr:low molecular weight protein arginine phosphatase [Puniceicoccales bacterium]